MIKIERTELAKERVELTALKSRYQSYVENLDKRIKEIDKEMENGQLHEIPKASN